MTDAQPPRGSGLRKDEHWRTALKLRMEKDQDKCEIWKDEVQNILVFSGLFSAIVTAFLIESHKSLRPDSGEQTVLILSQIAAQLAGNATVPQADHGGFLADNSSIRVNVFWFLSLVVSLTTALIGIISLQWIRIHLRVPSDDVCLSLSLLHMYSLAMDAFYVPHIFASLPVLLILSLAFFLIGLIDFLLDLNTTVAIPVVSAIGLTLAFLLITTTLPGLQSLPIVLPKPRKTPSLPCPYRSPQSLLFLRLMAIVKTPFRAISRQLALWVRLYRSPHKGSHNWMKDKIHSFLSRRFPEFFCWQFSRQWKNDWASHGQLWLLQRDVDRLELLQPSNDMLFHMIICSIERLCPPPAVFDTVQALLAVDSNNEDLTLRCIDDVLGFTRPGVDREKMLQYIISCFPESIYVPPADFLVKHCANDGILRDFAFITFCDNYRITPTLMDACLCTTSWLFSEPRILPAEVDRLVGHPLRLISCQASYPPSAYDSLLTILNHFFTFAAEYHPEAEDINKTLHTSCNVYYFLNAAAQILTKHPLTATAQTQHDAILSNVATWLEEDGGHDYLYLTAHVYASECLEWVTIWRMPWPLGSALISMLAALKQYKVGFENRRQAHEGINQLSHVLRENQIGWNKIDAALEGSRTSPVVTQDPGLEDAVSVTPGSITKPCAQPAVKGSEGPSGSVAQLEWGDLVIQQVTEADPPWGATGGHPLHNRTHLGITDPTHAAEKPEPSAPFTPSLEEILVVGREGGEAHLYGELTVGAGLASSDAPQVPDNPV